MSIEFFHRDLRLQRPGMLDNVEQQLNDDDRLARTIAPIIAPAITSSIRESRDAMIEALYPIGPRLGRPLNVTAFATADGGLDIGIALDPMAITDAERFRECMLETMGRMAQTAASVPVAEAAAREPCPDPSPTADPR